MEIILFYGITENNHEQQFSMPWIIEVMGWSIVLWNKYIVIEIIDSTTSTSNTNINFDDSFDDNYYGLSCFALIGISSIRFAIQYVVMLLSVWPTFQFEMFDGYTAVVL